jgi:8-oxo-dGTP diphosphatase
LRRGAVVATLGLLMDGTAVSTWIADLGIWPLVVMVLPTVFLFRRHGAGNGRKRLASLYQAIGVFLISTIAATVIALDLTDIYLLGGVLVIGLVAFLLRRRVFPYRRTCPECGHEHKIFTEEFKNIYVMDDDLCDNCRATR